MSQAVATDMKMQTIINYCKCVAPIYIAQLPLSRRGRRLNNTKNNAELCMIEQGVNPWHQFISPKFRCRIGDKHSTQLKHASGREL